MKVTIQIIITATMIQLKIIKIIIIIIIIMIIEF